MTPEQERAAFEAFFVTTNVKGRHRLEKLFERSLCERDSYADESTQRHWWTWQNARAAHTAETAMPVVPASAKPVAFVPVHRKHGPLWSDTFPATSEPSESRSRSYPYMPLFDAAPGMPPTQTPAKGRTMYDKKLQAIWESGMSVYYDDHLAFARAVAAAATEEERADHARVLAFQMQS